MVNVNYEHFHLGKAEGILRERARRLAKPMELTAGAEQIQILLIRLASGVYGIDVKALSALVPAGVVARVPGARSEVAGVVVFRGRVTPVVRLSILLGADDESAGRPCPLLVLRSPSRPVALVVHETLDVVAAPMQAGRQTASHGEPESTHYVYRSRDCAYWMIDVPMLLEHPVIKSISSGDV